MGKDTGGKEKTPSSKLFEVLDKVKRESGEKRGAANPVYYQKIMRYVQLKYRKRYLLRKKR